MMLPRTLNTIDFKNFKKRERYKDFPGQKSIMCKYNLASALAASSCILVHTAANQTSYTRR